MARRLKENVYLYGVGLFSSKREAVTEQPENRSIHLILFWNETLNGYILDKRVVVSGVFDFPFEFLEDVTNLP